MHSCRVVLSIALAGSLLACAEHSPSSPASQGAAPAPNIQTLSCVATVSAHTVSCTPLSPSTTANRSQGIQKDLIVGGQGVYVQVTSSNIAYDAGTQNFTFDVTVQNLIPQAMATLDGTTADPNGVRVFFSQAPVATSLVNPSGSSTITIPSPDGIATFTSANQPYYQYTGTALGADGILSTNETSSTKTWTFNVDPNVSTFGFFLYVSAAVPAPSGYVDVSPPAQSVLAGNTLSLTATPLSAVGNTVSVTPTWSTSDATIATVDNSGTVTGVAPGQVTITATAGLTTGTAKVSVCPNLAVGDAYVTSGTAADSVCLAGGASGQAEYVVLPFNGGLSSSLLVTATATGIAGVTGPPTPNLITSGAVLRNSLNVATMAQPGLETITDIEATVRQKQRLGLPSLHNGKRISAPSVNTTASQFGLRANRAVPTVRKTITPGVVPSVGDHMDLDVAQTCSGTPDIRNGVVKSVGQHAIIIADTANPAGGFTTAQYDSIAAEFDTLAFPVDSTNFGAPTDQDGNGHVVLFFTRSVNELSPPASSSVVQGYFNTKDVFARDPINGCQTSNEGEMLYMLVPDPTGAVNSNVRTVSFVRGNVSVTAGHQLQHMINSWRRTYVTGASFFEQTWLDEGLSTVAEELLFYKTSAGLAPRQNIALATLTTGPNASRRVAAFNTYMNQNFGRLRSWLQRPDTSGPYHDSGKDLSVKSLAARGVLEAFLRYAVDRVNGNDQTFWFNLVNSNLEGQANIQNAIGGVSPTDWYRDFEAALYADDNSFSVASTYQTPSWNFRSVYGGLGGFPLLTRPLTNGVGLTLSYATGGTSYLRLGVPTSGFSNLTFTSSGGPFTSSFALVVLRTK